MNEIHYIPDYPDPMMGEVLVYYKNQGKPVQAYWDSKVWRLSTLLLDLIHAKVYSNELKNQEDIYAWRELK